MLYLHRIKIVLIKKILLTAISSSNIEMYNQYHKTTCNALNDYVSHIPKLRSMLKSSINHTMLWL